MITFVPYNESHIGELTRMYNYYIENTFFNMHIKPISEEKMRELLHINERGCRLFIIDDDGETAGYAGTSYFKPREGFDKTREVSIYLSPRHTGKGTGKKALSHLIELSRDDAIHTLLAVATEKNWASIALFERAGFERCGLLKDAAYKFDTYCTMVIMQKIL